MGLTAALEDAHGSWNRKWDAGSCGHGAVLGGGGGGDLQNPCENPNHRPGRTLTQAAVTPRSPRGDGHPPTVHLPCALSGSDSSGPGEWPVVWLVCGLWVRAKGRLQSDSRAASASVRVTRHRPRGTQFSIFTAEKRQGQSAGPSDSLMFYLGSLSIHPAWASREGGCAQPVASI